MTIPANYKRKKRKLIGSSNWYAHTRMWYNNSKDKRIVTLILQEIVKVIS